MSATIYIAHTISQSSGGDVIGVYPSYQAAKADLAFRTGWHQDDADWGHFIRVGVLGVSFNNVLELPRSKEEYYDKR
jgi:hypothetical protein